jgi:hypothetical protein
MVRTYGHILIYTKNDDTVIDVSPNFNLFFTIDSVAGKPLAEVMTISKDDARVILDKLRKDKKLADLTVQIRNPSGNLQEVRVSGMAVTDPQNAYLGGNLLLRLRVADAAFDENLDQESRSMTRFLLVQSGSNHQAEIGQFLSDYYLTHIKSLLDMAIHQGGESISQTILDRLQETAKKHNWQIQFNLQTVLDSTNVSLEVLREALPVLLETAKGFVSAITDPVTVDARMREVDAQFSETILRDVVRYGKTGNEVGFSDHRKEPPTKPL